MWFKLFLSLIKKELAAELDRLVDGVTATDVETFKTKVKKEIHRLLGVT